MSDNDLCKLCQDNRAINVDLKVESASRKVLHKLFKCYQIDASILEERNSICKLCFEVVLQISESLEKWNKAQELLKATPLDIDDSKEFQIKLEPDYTESSFSEFQEEPLRAANGKEEPQTDDVEFLEDDDLVEEVFSDDSQMIDSEDNGDEMPKEVPDDSDWRSSLQNFFCACLGPDGLALTILFKDKTPKRNIRMLCTCCNQLFATLSEIQKHASGARAHPEYWCGVCNAIYPSIFELKVHEQIKRHSRPKTRAMVMRCLKCGQRSKQLSDAIKHENEAHDIPHFCQECRVPFECRESYEKHLLKQTYVCRYPNCINRYRSWEYYTKHLAWHKNRRSQCPIKGCAVVMEPRTHDRHLRTHLGGTQAGIVCKNIGKHSLHLNKI